MKPTLVIRDTTERQELIECGSTILCGTEFNNIMSSYKIILDNDRQKIFILPLDYTINNVSDIVINILS
jgi:UDP-N-acetylglucosamine 2-epimerase